MLCVQTSHSSHFRPPVGGVPARLRRYSLRRRYQIFRWRAAPRSRRCHLCCGRSSSARCRRGCFAGPSECVKNRDRDRHGGQRDNRYEDHEAGGCEQPTVFQMLAVGQDADPCRRYHGHKLSFALDVYSGRSQGNCPQGCCQRVARFLAEKWERETVDVLRLTSNRRLLDFFEDADYKCCFMRYASVVDPLQPLC